VLLNTTAPGAATPSFAAKQDFSTGIEPTSVTVGDLNGDGKLDLAVANFISSTVSVLLNTPTIVAATGLSRQQGSAAINSQIATVTNYGGNGSVSVTVTSANPSNGVAISNIVNTGGNITADIAAGCTTSNATFTLQASDGSSTVTDTLNITVTANTAPTLTYSSPQSVAFNGSLNVSPTAASDNGSITGYAVQSVVPSLTTPPTVNVGGVVSIINAQPAGTHIITIRATDNCGATTDASFTLTVNKAATSTSVSSSGNPSNFGQSVTFTATVTSTGVTPTGTVQFKDGGTDLGSPQTLNGSGVATFSTSSLVAGVQAISADYIGTTDFLGSTGTLSGGQQVGSIITFSATLYNTTESSRSATITVQRTGGLSSTVSVDYAAPDDSSATPTILPCSTPGFVSARCDFTTSIGTLTFAANESSKTFDVLISQDNYVEGAESLTLTLSNPSNGAALGIPSSATLTIADDLVEPAANPIDDSLNFVRQHYHDFLNREPDPSDLAGLNFWTNQIESCGADQGCRDLRRQNVSAAFFLSIEFQQTGYYVYRTYKAGFGDLNPPAVPVRYLEFVRDTHEVQRGVVVGQGNWQAQLDSNKQAYTLAFVKRQEFLNRYPALTPAAAFVDFLNANAGGVLTPNQRTALIVQLSASPGDAALRASVLMQVAENALLQQQEFNRAFVLMQYFGYLRRNPDAAPEAGLNFAGYNFWLNKLNQFNGNFIQAEMVKAFINSSEYRLRFGP